MSVMCLLPFSCSLEEETRTEVEKKNYMNNAEEAKDVLLGVYRTNTLDAMYGYYLSILFNLGTDISQVEGSGNENFRIIPTNSFPTTQSEVQQTWAALYTGIYRANDFLERISNKIGSYTTTDKKLATLYIAEARYYKKNVKITSFSLFLPFLLPCKRFHIFLLQTGTNQTPTQIYVINLSGYLGLSELSESRRQCYHSHYPYKGLPSTSPEV